MNKPTVFISYSHNDSHFVEELANRLKATDINVWIDKWNIRVGDSIIHRVNEGIEASDYLVVVLSQASVNSPWVKEELNAATIRNIEREKNAFILPVLIEECEIPPLLKHRKYANFKEDPNRALLELLAVIQPQVAQQTLESLEVLEPEIIQPAQPIKGLPRKISKSKQKAGIQRLQMILIPDGEFLMGSDPKRDRRAARNEQPQHTVYLPDYFLSKTPVTNMQYYAFVRNTVYPPPNNWWVGGIIPRGKENHPVVYVSFDDAVAFCEWLSLTTNKPYRIPTEAEWEKGARGTDGRIWPWGNARSTKRQRRNSLQSIESGIIRSTASVEEHVLGASPYGLLDTAGNVWEWTSSDFESYPYCPDDGREDIRNKKHLAVRGGAFTMRINFSRCACRMKAIAHSRREDLGFRIALSAGF